MDSPEVTQLKQQLKDCHLIMVTGLHLDDKDKALMMLYRYFKEYNISNDMED